MKDFYMLAFMKIGVYGLGRFGAFWASVLSQKFEVFGYNRSHKENLPQTIQLVDEQEVLSCDAIFLCVAISAMEPLLKNIAHHIKPGTLVFDTCSVKVYPVELMKTYLSDQVNIIATHPMFGPDSGKNGVQNLPIVYAPQRCTKEQSVYWHNIFADFGMKVITMTPEEHDKEAAYTQGITHFMGRVLGELSLKPSEMGTVGYRSLLTIIEQTCNDPMQLFFDLQRYNPYTHGMHVTLKKSIDSIMERLDKADQSSIGEK